MRDGKITSVAKATPPKAATLIDFNGAYLAPGFIDIHVHQGKGADFMNASEDAVKAACMAHVRHGTTTIFPTTMTGSPDQILAMLRACATVKQRNEGPNLEGVHLYGPYFSESKLGCHSSATWREMQVAFKAGMRHVDHFWCAMSSINSLRTRFKAPMQASMAEFVLMQDEMSTEVLADDWHLAPELLEFAFRMKGAKRLCLVTDCNRALDLPPGKYSFGNPADACWFQSDGKVG